MNQEQDITRWMLSPRERAQEWAMIRRAQQASRSEKHHGLLGKILQLEAERGRYANFTHCKQV